MLKKLVNKTQTQYSRLIINFWNSWDFFRKWCPICRYLSTRTIIKGLFLKTLRKKEEFQKLKIRLKFRVKVLLTSLFPCDYWVMLKREKSNCLSFSFLLVSRISCNGMSTHVEEKKGARHPLGNPDKTVPTDLRNDISRRLSKPCCSDATVTAMGTMVS